MGSSCGPRATLPGSRRSALAAATVSSALAALGISVAQLLAGSALLPRLVVFGSAVTVVPVAAACSALAAAGRARDGHRDRVVAVVGLDEGLALGDELGGSPERPAELAGVVHPAEAGTCRPGSAPLVERVVETGATTLVLGRAAQSDDSIVVQAAQLHESGVRVRTLSLFYDEWLGKLPVSELERVSLMFDIGELHRARYGRVKRLVDAALALAGVVPLALVLPVVALVNRFANPGPLFFRQDRVGKGGEVFPILKLRTMRPGGDASAWTSKDDPRITSFGAWLRRTHLDELPQVVNVLRGHLAIVGPRPEQPGYVEQLEAKIPFYRLRHLVRPGLTGWAQVKYPYGGTEADALEKLQYEFFYLRHQSLALDLRIVGRTLRSVAGRSGR